MQHVTARRCLSLAPATMVVVKYGFDCRPLIYLHLIILFAGAVAGAVMRKPLNFIPCIQKPFSGIY
jgi:hypothetical protein